MSLLLFYKRGFTIIIKPLNRPVKCHRYLMGSDLSEIAVVRSLSNVKSLRCALHPQEEERW